MIKKDLVNYKVLNEFIEVINYLLYKKVMEIIFMVI
jgi:hypothetical protein